MNNINTDLVNKKYSKIEEEIAKMDSRDLIYLQSSLVDEFHYNPSRDDFIGTTGRNYGKFGVSRNELLEIVNMHLIGKRTSDWLESATTPFSHSFDEEQSFRISRK